MKMTKDGITRDVEECDVSKFEEMGFVAQKPEPQPEQENVRIASEKTVTRKRRAG